MIEYHYYLIEDFIDREYCAKIAKFFTDNMQEDRRPLYGFYPIDGKDYFFTEKGLIPQPYDPERKLNKAIEFGFNFFKENYKMLGELELNRSHGNFMFKGAKLDEHCDDVHFYGQDTDELPSRTYVMGIFLNDDYEGGEIYFPDSEDKAYLKPKAGSLLFFPGFKSTHGVAEVTSGVRINILVDYFDITDKSKIEFIDGIVTFKDAPKNY